MIAQAAAGHGLAPAPVRYLFIAVAVLTLAQFWLPSRGLYRVAARRGGWQLAIAVLESLIIPIFTIGLVMAEITIVITTGVIGVLLSVMLLVLMTKDKQAGQESGTSATEEGSGTSATEESKTPS